MVAEQRGCSTAVIEMAEFLQKVGEQPSELSVEDRNLRSVAYGSTAGSRRAAWRIVAGVEQKEKFKDMEQQASHAREYIAKVGDEIQRIRDGIPAFMDENLIPKRLNFVKDVVDSEDIHLNVYCETLQQNKILHSIKMNLAKKYLEMLAEITELNDDCKKFYEQFGKRLKLGIQKGFIDGAEIAGLLRLNTPKPGDEQISFKEYEDQLAMDTKFLQSLKTRCSGTQQGVNMCVQHVVNAVEVEKRIIQEQINQVTRHVETLLLQIVEKTFEIPELQFTDKVDIPVVTHRQIHMNPDVLKTIEIPQL